MKKVELLEVEVAALLIALDTEIRRAQDETNFWSERAKSRGTIGSGHQAEYWTEQLHMLRQLKAKLEREEE